MVDENIRRHCEPQRAERYNGLQGQLRRENLQKLLAGPTKQQSIFTRIRDISAATIKAGHLIANDIALALKNVMREEFLKSCKLKAVEIACPEKR